MPTTIVGITGSRAVSQPYGLPHSNVLIASYLAKTYHAAPYGAAVLANHLDQWASANKHPLSSSVLALPHDTAPDDAVATILAEAPTLVGISLYVWNYTQSLALASALRAKAPNIVLVCGGPHVSRDDPRLTAALAEGVLDYCVLGEGEYAFTRIVSGEFLAPGSFIDGGTVDFGGRLSPYATQPVLRQDLARTATAIVEGARGCPFTCTFCDQGWRKARLAQDAALQDELSMLYDLGARHFYFLDPTFNYHRIRMRALLDFMRTHLPGATFSAELKVELLDDLDISSLKQVCTAVEAGLQTSNLATLKRIRRHEDVERLWRNIRALMDAGITVSVNTIFGLPGESLSDWLTTVDDCFDNTDAAITATCLKILPNTEIWSQREEYCYEWNEEDLFRALVSTSMSSTDFATAERLGKLLAYLHRPGPTISAEVREFIVGRLVPTLSAFLTDFSAGRVVLRADELDPGKYVFDEADLAGGDLSMAGTDETLTR